VVQEKKRVPRKANGYRVVPTAEVVVSLQEKTRVPRKANGYRVVPTTEVVVSLQDKLGKRAGSNGHCRYLERWARAGPAE